VKPEQPSQRIQNANIVIDAKERELRGGGHDIEGVRRILSSRFRQASELQL
jgi:hypothetical protein